MRGFMLAQYLSCLPIVYSKLFAITCINTLPPKIPKGHFVLVNKNHSKTEPDVMGHWFLIFRVSSSHYEIFDPAGVSKSYIKEHLKYPYSTITINNSNLQPKHSTLCGVYCLVYAHEKVLNYDMSMHDVINLIFSENCSANEKRCKLEQKRILRKYYTNGK